MDLQVNLDLVSKELNHLAAILYVYAGSLIFMKYKRKKIITIFQKEIGNTFTLLIIFIVKSLQKEQNSTNLLL
jgi:high-affinity Fe2+/Pb2+ permease